MAKEEKAKVAAPEKAGQDKAPEKAAAEIKVSKLVVRSKVAGFRRAGRVWPAEEVTVDADEFTADQIKQLLADPMLVVLPVAAE